jgi:hypothetical protein
MPTSSLAHSVKTQDPASAVSPAAERPAFGNPRIGRLFAASQAIAEACPATTPEDALIAVKVRALMTGYELRWGKEPWRTLAVEQLAHVQLVNPETGKPSRTFSSAGKLDAIVVHSETGRKMLVEHKSTGDSIEAADAPYWQQAQLSSQVSKYLLLAWQLGCKLDGCVYDVIRKPSIKPRKLSKKEGLEIVGSGRYFGAVVSAQTFDRVLRGTQLVECPELYGYRLSADIRENLGSYFQRREVPRPDHDLVEYARELWDAATEMREARHHGRHLRNPDACMKYGRPCAYLGICSGYDTPDSDKWQKRADVHPELEGLSSASGGRDVLTNSRLKTWLTCRRQHFYRYELGIQRRDDRDENLFFGHVMHKALEAWYAHESLAISQQHQDEAA